ncbi:MAG: hypothetical protein GY696_10260 [Gammaproteobacteria bacterium]|nr:hypothetical protein [Gammaproteobacteria bacterium]
MQIWASTGAEVSTLTEGWFQTYFPDKVMQPTTKIFEAFNVACQPASGQFTASFHGGSKVPILLYILPNECMSLLGVEDMGMMDLVIDTKHAASTGLESHRLQCLPALYLSLLRSYIPPKCPMPSQSLNTVPGCSQG